MGFSKGHIMNEMVSKPISCLLIMLLIFQVSLFAQDDIDNNVNPTYGTDSENGTVTDGETIQEESPAAGQDESIDSPDLQSETNSSVGEQNNQVGNTSTPTSSGTIDESGFQNAIIEGVQLTAEPGAQPDEKIIAGYFIFRDKPSSYFYEVKLREKKLIFEFNDTRVGASPVPTASEAPIKGFIIEQGKIDVNKAVKGLKPEWHDLIRVVFDLDAVPDVHVNDEYSIISFSFKWSTDPEKQAKYTVKDKTPKVILWSTAGVGGIALGAMVAYILWRPEKVDETLDPLDVGDLPDHDPTN